MIVGTAGHIDHGKSTLVKALTGTDPDRLQEEKARGITIDLGYAYAPLPDGTVLGFVDVPGHEKLVHNMLAGATGIDFVLLVVAADDGVMPQTREHLEILDLLGLASGAVALTKVDLVDRARADEVEAEVRALLAPTALADMPVMRVSAATGEGIETLRAHLAAAAGRIVQRRTDARFRLAVDRSFTLPGIGVVITGTAFAGRVSVGDVLIVTPSGRRVRVRGVHAQNTPREHGDAGERCALNVSGDNVQKADFHRGDWVVAEPLHRPTQRIDVSVRVVAGAPRALRHWTPVHFYLGAGDHTGRIALLSAEEVAPGGAALAQVVLDRPTHAARGDRFVLRDQSAAHTVGGGTVLDPFGPARHRRTSERLAVLEALGRAEPDAGLRALLAHTPTGIDLERVAAAFNAATDARWWDEVPMRAVATPEGRVAFSPEAWADMRRKVVAALGEYHGHSPDELGPDRDRLRRIAVPFLSRAAFTPLVEELAAEGLVTRAGAFVHLPGHRIQLGAAEEQLRLRILPKLDDAAFDPPWVRDIAREFQLDERYARALMQRLARLGDVHQVVRDLFYSARAVARLADIARDVEAADGEIRAAAFRDRIGVGRKRAIQILEFFDRAGYTRRAGDAHRIRPGAADIWAPASPPAKAA
jgi:selenocysteine-specific elongation factor